MTLSAQAESDITVWHQLHKAQVSETLPRETRISVLANSTRKLNIETLLSILHPGSQ